MELGGTGMRDVVCGMEHREYTLANHIVGLTFPREQGFGGVVVITSA